MKGLVPSCALGFAPHIERNAGRDLLLGAHTIDTLLHLAIAPIAPFHRIRGRGEQFVIEKRQGFFQIGREHLFEGLANPLEARHPLPQLLELGNRCLRPATPVKQGVQVIHDLPQLPQVRQPSGDVQEPLAFAPFQAPFDKQVAILEQVTDFLVDRFTFASTAARFLIVRRGPAALQLRLGLA